MAKLQDRGRLCLRARSQCRGIALAVQLWSSGGQIMIFLGATVPGEPTAAAFEMRGGYLGVFLGPLARQRLWLVMPVCPRFLDAPMSYVGFKPKS